MRLRKAGEIKPDMRVKWKTSGETGWWRTTFVSIDGRYARIDRRGVSQFVPIGSLRVRA